MKKIIAILLSLALLLGCAAGVAEGEKKQTFGVIRANGEFTLKGILPEGYKVIPFQLDDDTILSFFRSEDATKPELMLSIAYDETYSDVDRLNDLDDDALAILEKTFTDTDPYANITYDETAYGTRLLLSRTQTESYDALTVFSIYKGYFVEFTITPSKVAVNEKLTDEEIEQCIHFLSELDFVEGAEKEEVKTAGNSFTANITGFDAEAKTIDVSLLTPIVMTEWDAVKINEGDKIQIGKDEVEIATLSYDGDDAVINDEYYLRKNEEGLYNPYFYESPILQEVKEMTITVADSVVYTEEIDPESGVMLDEKKTLTAADLFAALEAAKNGGLGFASENVTVTFGDDGEVTEIDRFYAPWQ